MDEEDTADESATFFTQEELDDRSEERDRDKCDIASSSSISKGSRKRRNVGEREVINTENEDDGDGDGGDDGSSISSSSSSQSNSSISSTGSTSSEVSLTLLERQARNIARNERFLGSLREKYKDQLGTQPSRKRTGTKDDETRESSGGEDDEEEHNLGTENLGMVREGTHRLFRFDAKDTRNDPNSDLDEHEALARSYRSLASGLKELERRYPHREVQIGRLYALLSSTVSLTATIAPMVASSSAASVYVPAPIFCVGARGAGKTSIVCDVVGLLASRGTVSPSTQPAARMQPAYIDCSIVEPSTVERLVYTIYKQLKPSSSTVPDDKAAKRKRINRMKRNKHKKRKRTGASAISHQPSKAENDTKNDATDETDTHQAPPNKPQHQREDEYESNQPRVLPSRRAKKAAIHKSLASNATTYQNVRKNRTEDAANDGDETDTDEEDDSDEEGVTTMHSPVLGLGRSLQKHYGSHIDDNGGIRNRGFRKKPRCAILVLDKAEELLSLSSSSKRGTSSSGGGGGANNYLTELLLLPKIMKLNLTIVVVTNYYTLHMTRLNNAADPSRALGTISNAIHPIIVQFPAYKGTKVFTEILSTEENRKLILGNSLTGSGNALVSSAMRQSLKDKLVRSFLNTIVQFVSDATRDLRDFRRLGRSLWPSFVAPLHPSVLRTTLGGAASKLGIEGGLTRAVLSDPVRYSEIEDEVVRLLGTRFYARVSSLAAGDDSLTLLTLDEDGVLPVVAPSATRATTDAGSGDEDGGGRILQIPNLGAIASSFPQPYLRSCLLLAAFVCQHNKADRDRKLFSAIGNGKRRKSRAKEDIYGGNDEDVAFGSTSTKSGSTRQRPKQVEELRSLKLRPVPLERVFSIFTTLVRLNPRGGEGDGADRDDADLLEATMDDLGSSRLYTDMAHLIDLGYLHPVGPGGNASSMAPHHLAPSRILCKLAREEALEISDRIGIPLERYLL